MFRSVHLTNGTAPRATHLLVLSLALSICWVTKLTAQDQKFVAGQALAKFVAGSAGDAAVTRAAQASPPDLGALASAVNDLESGVGLPLLATQVSSGNWFIVSMRTPFCLHYILLAYKRW